MPIDIAVSLPIDDPDAHRDLAALATGTTNASQVAEQRPFDGQAALEAVVTLSPATYPFFRTWVRSRIDRRKQFKVISDGIEMTGYTADEAEQILKRIQESMADEENVGD
jgi:hypothetical protein